MWRIAGRETTSVESGPCSMPRQPLTCRQVIGDLDDYVAGELSAPRRSAVEAHLSECKKCSAYCRSYAATIAKAKRAYSVANDAEGDVREDLVRSILRTRRRR